MKTSIGEFQGSTQGACSTTLWGLDLPEGGLLRACQYSDGLWGLSLLYTSGPLKECFGESTYLDSWAIWSGRYRCESLEECLEDFKKWLLTVRAAGREICRVCDHLGVSDPPGGEKGPSWYERLFE